MPREVKEPAWYGSIRPDGSWVSLVQDSHLESSNGRIELPGTNVLYLDHAIYRGQMMIAGQANSGPHRDQCMLKKGMAEWKPVGAAFGMSMVRFSDDGRWLFVVDSPETGYYIDLETDQKTAFSSFFGVNGIRSVHGPNRTMQTGLATEFNPSLRVSKFTTLDNGLVIGQGRTRADGIIAIRGNDRRQLETGLVNFYLADQVGDTLSIAMVKLAEKRCVLHRIDVGTLDNYPFEVPDIVDPIPVIGRSLWLGWLEFVQPTVMPPGNGLIRTGPMNGQFRKFDGTFVGQWVQGDSVEIIEQQAGNVHAPIAYWDGRNWPRWPTLPAKSWLALQAYQKTWETREQFAADMRRIIASAPAGQKLALVCQVYTQNTDNTADIASLVPLYAQLAIDHLQIEMLIGFSDQGRDGGMNHNPDVRPLWQQLANGITGEPADGGGGGVMLDWGRVHEYGVRRWAELEVNRKSQELVDQGQNCRPFQQEMFVLIAKELYWKEGVRFDLFWKAGIPDFNNPTDVANKLAHIGEDIVVDTPNMTYKDVVGNMGLPIAAWGALGGTLPVTPGDEHRCAPPPKLEGDIEPGPILVEILYHDQIAHRSDPNGMEVRFNVTSTRPIVLIDLDLIGDDEPSIPVSFPAEERRDGRYVRGLRWKPVRNGVWSMVVTATDDQGHVGKSDGSHMVTVMP